MGCVRFSLPGGGRCGFRGRAAAMGTGVGRGMTGCIATAVIMATGAVGQVWFVKDKGLSRLDPAWRPAGWMGVSGVQSHDTCEGLKARSGACPLIAWVRSGYAQQK